ncbi:MAG: hypothetical protein CL455_02570, partial [Acidimicrobiaceae bacterium]|nr:hypothetical protein [Acidimicrobiaceae bacterium]
MSSYNFASRIKHRFAYFLSAIVIIPVALVLVASPAAASVSTFDCTSYDGPIFIEDDGNSNIGYNARELNLSTGSYGNVIFTIKFSQSGRSWDYNQINGIAINPVDGKAYGVMGGVDANHSKFLVRFDDDANVEFIAKVDVANTSATIDVHGDYLYLGSGNYGLYRIENVANLTGYTDPDNNSILDKTSISTILSSSDSTWGGGIADIQAIRADLDLGGIEDYVIGVRNSDSGGTKVTVARYSGSTDVWHLTPDETMFTRPWRGAWYSDGRLLFMEKKGNLYELEINNSNDIDLSAGTADVTFLSDTSNIKDGDGMACYTSPGFTVTQTSGSTVVSETGTTDTFTVVLNSKPAGDVQIDLTNPDIGEATLDDQSLTFTTADWDTPQTVTATGVDDLYVDGNQGQTITFSIDDSGTDDVIYEAVANQTITVTTQDNENAGFTIVESGGATEVSESGTTDTFTVVLNARPLTNVLVSTSSADTGEITVTNNAILTFTTNNWDTPQTVTVTGFDDSDIDGDQSVNLSVAVVDASSDDNFDGLTDVLTAVNLDDDNVGYTVTESGGSTAVSEDETTDTFTVVLNGQPSSSVVFSIASDDEGELTVSAGTLAFTTGNWDTPQTVTVTGVDDTIIDGNQSVDVTVSVIDGSSDDNFDELADVTITAAANDNDDANYVVNWPLFSEGGGSGAAEPDGTSTFSVNLTVQPNSNVYMSVVSGDLTAATVSTAELTFTPQNWNNPQNVTVTGVDDDLIDGNQNVDITVSVIDATSDDNFDPLDDSVFTFTIEDDDVAGFTVVESGGSTGVSEGGSTDTFTVVLDAQPDNDVVLNIAIAGDEGTLSAASLTFTSENWDTAQTITVTGVDDNLIDGDQESTITIYVDTVNSDINFASLIAETLTLTTTDDDVAGFTVVESGGSTGVSEGGSTDTFTVVLDAQPDSNVEFTLYSNDHGEVIFQF